MKILYNRIVEVGVFDNEYTVVDDWDQVVVLVAWSQ